jgi:hypothetical protein
MAGTLVANTINTDTGLFSTNNAYSGIAKAWVQFGGSTPTINGQFNVSSITRNSAGDYTINFTTAMTNINYSVIGSASLNSAGTSFCYVCPNSQASSPYYSAPTTSSCRIMTSSNGSNSSAADCYYISITVIGI